LDQKNWFWVVKLGAVCLLSAQGEGYYVFFIVCDAEVALVEVHGGVVVAAVSHAPQALRAAAPSTPAPHLHPILPSRTKPANPVSQPNPKGYAGSQPPLFSRSFSNSTSGSAVVSSVLFWPTVAAVPHSLLPAPCNC
jgi:hypothetical protein